MMADHIDRNSQTTPTSRTENPSFESALAALAADRAAKHPVAVAKTELAPIRELCENALVELAQVASEVRPVLARALEKWDAAGKAGVAYNEIHRIANDGYRLIEGTENGLRGVIAGIDGLDAHAVHFDVHRHLPTQARQYRANIAAVRGLVQTVESHVRTLETMVRERAADAVPPVPIGAIPDPPQPMRVETAFDPRRA